jgi:large subunit ribosomal protein L20
MARVKRGTIKSKKHKKVLKEASGYYGSKSRSYKIAKEQLAKSMSYAYRDRKNNKRNFRRLWIVRINAAARINGLSYNEFIFGLKKASININRKMLSEMAVNDIAAFKELADVAKKTAGIR